MYVYSCRLLKMHTYTIYTYTILFYTLTSSQFLTSNQPPSVQIFDYYIALIALLCINYFYILLLLFGNLRDSVRVTELLGWRLHLYI